MVCLGMAVLVTFALGGRVQSQDQASNPDSDVETIEQLLKAQDAAWNKGDIESFMQTYWKSDELTFSGGGTTTRGWQATLDNYKKRYPAGSMGQLRFDHLETTTMGPATAMVLGQWYLEMEDKTKRDGNFTLLLRKFDDGWKIVHDHSSTREAEKGWISVEQAKLIGASHMRLWDQPIDAQLQKHIAIIRVDISNGQTGFGRDPIFVNRKTGMVSKRRPAEIR